MEGGEEEPRPREEGGEEEGGEETRQGGGGGCVCATTPLPPHLSFRARLIASPRSRRASHRLRSAPARTEDPARTSSRSGGQPRRNDSDGPGPWAFGGSGTFQTDSERAAEARGGGGGGGTPPSRSRGDASRRPELVPPRRIIIQYIIIIIVL